ncbi:MAG: DNA-processing protein DprA [Phycisphaerae bacterium]|nr:DNA-processing protein DprA [Phycisphaerae bacterium]
MSSTERLRATLRLFLAGNVGPKTFHRLVEIFGDVVTAAEAGPLEWKRVKGIGPKTLDALKNVTDEDIDSELTEAERLGAKIICVHDDSYPQQLLNIHTPPPLLYVRGRLEPNDAVSLGVVGSRRCTYYGSEQAERFGSLLGRAGFTVLSGGARGIDTAAHRGALAAGGRTVAVMGCGLSHTYPPENEQLFEQIVREDRGALVSELPMRTSVLAGNFPTRNRIISGLGLGVLVIEAGVPSGALITARVAAEQGRTVFALPGRVDSPTSCGTNKLIREGAHVVTELDDILDPLGEVGRQLAPDDPPPAPLPDMNEMEISIYNTLENGALTLDEIVYRTERETPQIAASMTMLVLRGVIVQQPGNVFVRKAR